MRQRHPRVSAGRAQPVITAGQRPRPDFWHLTSQPTDHPARAADRRRPGIRSNALPRLRPTQHAAAGRPQYPRAEIGRGRDPRRAAPQHGRVATRTGPRRSDHSTPPDRQRTTPPPPGTGLGAPSMRTAHGEGSGRSCPSPHLIDGKPTGGCRALVSGPVWGGGRARHQLSPPPDHVSPDRAAASVCTGEPAASGPG